MKQKHLTGLLCGLFLLAFCVSCSSNPPSGPSASESGETLHIVATTYPVYLFATAVTEGVEGVEVTQLITDQISCLHDYTLTVTAMRAIETADVIVMNGAGLEDFMDDALAASDATVIDCSEGIDLLPARGHEGHDHDTEYDPHIWMDPWRAIQMIETIQTGLSQLDAAHSEAYLSNCLSATTLLDSQASVWTELLTPQPNESTLKCRELITFHDGFAYLADAYGFTILQSIEEEEGSEASAAEIREIISLIEEHHLPAIFTEVNGSDATAQAIARETGVQVASLSMLMSGNGTGIAPYCDGLRENMETIINSLGEGEVHVS